MSLFTCIWLQKTSVRNVRAVISLVATKKKAILFESVFRPTRFRDTIVFNSLSFDIAAPDITSYGRGSEGGLKLTAATVSITG